MVKALIIGATGRQDGATARSLLKAGHEVHALVRTPDSKAAQALKAQGAVLFEGNTDDLDAIKATMAGTAGEESVRSAGLKYYPILRPHEIMSNLVLRLAAFQFPDMTSTGVWNSAFTPGFRNQYIDTEDIGCVAVADLLNPEGWNGREVEIVAERVPVGKVVELVSAAADKQLSLRTLGGRRR
ncbi:hypothetical protein DL767_002289 [Monosporascus sp. MG133]|nr:hypothetical protein DL767_002289 [Monosporascus sp. MG133]